MSPQPIAPATRTTPSAAVGVLLVMIVTAVSALVLAALGIERAVTTTEPIAALLIGAVVCDAVAIMSLGWLRLHSRR